MPVQIRGPGKIGRSLVRSLGIFKYGNKIYLSFLSRTTQDTFSLAVSDNGFDFELLSTEGVIYSANREKIDLSQTSSYRFSRVDHLFLATFLHKETKVCLPNLAKMNNLRSEEHTSELQPHVNL